MNEYEYKNFSLKAIDVDVKGRTVKGMFASFNTVDDGGDIIRYGAFSKSISERGVNSIRPRIKHLLNHNPFQTVGVLSVLEEKADGLYYESILGRHTLGVDTLKMYDDGIITEHSIGYKTVKSTPTSDGFRSLDEVKLWEGSSLTAWGMNENTPVLKSLDDVNKYIQRVDDWKKALKNGTYTDESFEMLENMFLQMKSMLAEIVSLKLEEPNKITHQVEPKISEAKAIEFLNAIQELNNKIKS